MAGTTTYLGITYPTSTDYVKDGAAAIQTVATGFDTAFAIPTFNAQTGTTYTFALSDLGKTVTASNASASTYTIPPQASVVWPTNAQLNVRNIGAGVVTIAGGAGVTVTNSALTIPQYASVRLTRTASNAWTVTPEGGGAGYDLINVTNVTAANSINLANVFTSTYTNYVAFVSVTTTVGSGNVALNGTIAGTNTGPWTTVGWTMGVSAGTGSSSNLGTGNQGVASAPIANMPASGQGGFYINFQQPQLANRTGVQFSGAVADGGSGLTSLQGAAISYGVDQLDGFKLTYGGTSFTGTVRVYGLRNL